MKDSQNIKNREKLTLDGSPSMIDSLFLFSVFWGFFPNAKST
jgi:hypothetical protein